MYIIKNIQLTDASSQTLIEHYCVSITFIKTDSNNDSFQLKEFSKYETK